MNARLSLAVSTSVLFFLACGSQGPASDTGALSGPAAVTEDAAGAAAHEPCSPSALTVMTRNLYIGAEVAGITQIDPGKPEQLVLFATAFWSDVQASDFPARARILADEIAEARPEVVGLQEVATYRTTDLEAGEQPGVCGGSAPSPGTASHVELDFLAILRRELRHRGLRYEVAARVTTLDLELCMMTGTGELTDLRYTDHDVILVRSDVDWRRPSLPDPLPVPLSTLPGDSNGAVYGLEKDGWPETPCFDVGEASVCDWRGWTAVEVRAGHGWVRVFETHLEDQMPGLPVPADLFQTLQASELVGILAGAAGVKPLPTVLLGDFNAYVEPRKPAEEMAVYGLLTAGPFPLVDAWTAVRHGNPGYTWGSEELGKGFFVDSRLDLVLATEDLRPTWSYLVGLRDTTPGGLHPSDHAGIVTTFAVR